MKFFGKTSYKWLTFFGIALAFQATLAGPQCSDLFLNLSDKSVIARLQKNKFETGRGLDTYESFLAAEHTPSLSERIQSLPEGSVYLDAGAGTAQAIRDVIKSGVSDLNFVAVAFQKPMNSELDRVLDSKKDTFKYFDGAYLETMLTDAKYPLFSYKSKVALITEIFGPLAYSKEVAETLAAYADLLKVGGEALLYFSESNTRIYARDKNGELRRVTFRELSPVLIPLMTGGRLRVKQARMRRSDNGAAMFETTVLWLEKAQETTQAPDNPLRLVEYTDDAPPVRVYEVDPAAIKNLNLEKLRDQDIQREESEFQPLNVPKAFH